MAWTYTNDPLNVPLDELRFLIGDIDGTDPQLTDEELSYLLSTEGAVLPAAIAAVRGLVALFARKTDKSVGDLSVSYSQRAENYRNLLRDLQHRSVMRSAGPIVGGTSLARKEVVASDPDRVPPDSFRGQFDHPGNAS